MMQSFSLSLSSSLFFLFFLPFSLDELNFFPTSNSMNNSTFKTYACHGRNYSSIEKFVVCSRRGDFPFPFLFDFVFNLKLVFDVAALFASEELCEFTKDNSLPFVVVVVVDDDVVDVIKDDLDDAVDWINDDLDPDDVQVSSDHKP